MMIIMFLIKDRGKFLESDLIAAESNMMGTLAQLNAQDKMAAGLAKINSNDQELMLEKLSGE